MKNGPFPEKISLSSEGTWLSNGGEITHERTLELFTQSLQRDVRGYFLKIRDEEIPVSVEDTPYFVTSVSESAEGKFQLTLNDGSREELDPSSLSYRPGRLTCRVKQGLHEAKFLRGPYYELLERIEEDESGFYLEFTGKRIRL